MTRYILDTDHLSLYQRGDTNVGNRLSHVPPDQIAITVITAEETIRGRFARIKAAQTEAAKIQAYHWLNETLELLKDFSVLPYDQNASTVYESLRQQKLRVGS